MLSVPLDDDLRYLLEVRSTLQESLRRESRPDEILRLEALLRDIENRIKERRRPH